jgi:hypothetical protein
MRELEFYQLKKKVKTAVGLFLDNDKKLLDLKVYEPAVSHRVAVYLEKIFNDENLNYDCEYDKYFDLSKSTPNGKKIRPDILVHKRNDDKNNILTIEIKKNRKSKWDENKLKELTSPQGKFKYELGVFIYFPNGKPEYEWFVNGITCECFENRICS